MPFLLTSSVMPKLSAIFIRWITEVPPSLGSVWAIDCALISACLSASGVETSGVGAPSRMTTPKPMRPRSTRLPGMILPVFSSSAISGAEAMIRSAGSPDAMVSRSSPVGPVVKLNLMPVCFE